MEEKLGAAVQGWLLPVTSCPGLGFPVYTPSACLAPAMPSDPPRKAHLGLFLGLGLPWPPGLTVIPLPTQVSVQHLVLREVPIPTQSRHRGRLTTVGLQGRREQQSRSSALLPQGTCGHSWGGQQTA